MGSAERSWERPGEHLTARRGPVGRLRCRSPSPNKTRGGLSPSHQTLTMKQAKGAGGGYRIVSEVINSFGVQLEPNHEGFPAKSKR